MALLSNATSNTKTKKMLTKFKYEGVIQYLSPDKIADGHKTVCPWSTHGCRTMCLNTSGRGVVTGELTKKNLNRYFVHKSRIKKTLNFLYDRPNYITTLKKELINLNKRAKRKKYAAVARLNGTSDLSWEKYIKMGTEFADIQFYDYTKGYSRMVKYLNGKLPMNYYLTYSYNEKTTPEQVKYILSRAGTIAVVFKGKLPKTFMGATVINGDTHDFRFRDPVGVIVGLTAKGRAKKDTTGFVVGE